LKARTSTTTFMENLDTVDVQSGGAIIDSNGFNVTSPTAFGRLAFRGFDEKRLRDFDLTGNPTYTGNTLLNIGALQLNTGNTTLAAISGAGNLIVGDTAITTQLTVSSINVGTLTIAANSMVTIQAIPAGRKAAQSLPCPNQPT